MNETVVSAYNFCNPENLTHEEFDLFSDTEKLSVVEDLLFSEVYLTIQTRYELKQAQAKLLLSLGLKPCPGQLNLFRQEVAA